MIYEGFIKTILAEEAVGQNNIPKQTFVLEEDSDREYKGSIAIDLFKEKLDLLKPLKVGDKVSVSLNARCNEYKGKYYNSITGWKIEKLGGPVVESTATEEILPF